MSSHLSKHEHVQEPSLIISMIPGSGWFACFRSLGLSQGLMVYVCLKSLNPGDAKLAPVNNRSDPGLHPSMCHRKDPTFPVSYLSKP